MVRNMPSQSIIPYRRCFISAPFAMDLGELPAVLAERGIEWEWAKEASTVVNRQSSDFALADFVLVVINGTRADYRGAFDAGVAVGLRKPILVIQTNSREIPLDFQQFTTVKTGLRNRDALRFHLDLFLATPAMTVEAVDVKRPSRDVARLASPAHFSPHYAGRVLELRAYDAVVAAGGSAILEPENKSGSYRPDLLAWLGHLDAELLDPVLIEVRRRVDSKIARELEQRILGFMQASRVRMALVLTEFPPPERKQQLSPNLIWLTLDEFEKLARNAGLGSYVRETRNRIAHGVR